MVRRARVLVPLVIFLGACTGGAASSSSPSPSLSVGEAFLAKARDPTFSARYTVQGDATVNGVHLHASGQGEQSGENSHEQDTVSAQGTTFKQTEVVVDGNDYLQQSGGPWVQQPGANTDPFQRLTSVDDLGAANQNGQTVEHLRLPSDFQLLLSDVGLADQGVTNFSGSADFYAMSDGTPVSLVVTLTYDQNATHVSGTTTITYADMGTPVTITAPSQFWTLYRSDAGGYSIAHPSDWRETVYKKEPVLVDPSGFKRIWESSLPVPSNATLKQLVGYVAKWEKVAAVPDSAKSMTIDGAPAEVLTYHIAVAGRPSFFQQADVLAQGHAYVIWWASKPGSEREDSKTFQDALSTFTVLSGSGTSTV